MPHEELLTDRVLAASRSNVSKIETFNLAIYRFKFAPVLVANGLIRRRFLLGSFSKARGRRRTSRAELRADPAALANKKRQRIAAPNAATHSCPPPVQRPSVTRLSSTELCTIWPTATRLRPSRAQQREEAANA
eukprot:5148503-Pleurochrysis_carterae.AAC.2